MHIMCYSWSVFLFKFVLFCFPVITMLDHIILVWERDMLRFFIRILLCFTYILLSILSYCLFASKLSLLVFILFRAASCLCLTLLWFTYICLESCLWFLVWFVGLIKCHACGSGVMKNLYSRVDLHIWITWNLPIVLRC